MKKSNIKGIAVDIDETLSMTVGYWARKLQKKIGNPENLSAVEIVKKYKYTQNVPYWQTKEALDFMGEMREQVESHRNLQVIKGSVSALKKIDKIIPIVAYITARSENLSATTIKWLDKKGFPKADVILKPNDISFKIGNKWKANLVNSLYPKVVAIIDDNPKLIDYLPKNYKGTVFLYDSENYKSKKVKVISCKNWKQVLLAVKNLKV